MEKRITFWTIWMISGASILLVGGLAAYAQAWSPEYPVGAPALVALVDPNDPAINLLPTPVTIRSAQEMTATIYLPIVNKNYFDPYTYQDDFSNWGSGWAWGTSPFVYGYKQDGDGSRVYHVRLDDQYETAFITGPSHKAYALGNFEYVAWIRRTEEMPLYWYDEYGILLSPTPIDPANPSGSNAYTFHIKLRIDPSYDSFYAVARWNTLNRDRRTILVENPEAEYITDLPKFWNKLKIVRTGNRLDFYITREYKSDWKLVLSHTDNTLPPKLHVGFYAMHSKDDLGKYTIEFQFDNLQVDAHP